MRSRAILLVCIALIYSAFGYGQEYEVLDAKRSFRIGGDKIRKGDRLNNDDVVLIKDKGHLTLDINYPRKLSMDAGKYQLDSLIGKLKIRYANHKRLYALLEKEGLIDCHFAYQLLIVPGTNSPYEAGRITVLEEKIESTNADSLKLNVRWKNPDKNYQGNYSLIIQEAFGQELLIDVIETENSSATLNLYNYDEQYMHYSIMAKDCRASRAINIKLKL